MHRIFDMENPFWTFLNKLADLVIVELLCLLTCIPIFTIGASFSAFWHCTLRLAKDEEGKIVVDYFRAFKSNFRTGTVVGAVWFGVMAFLVADWYICLQMKTVFAVFLMGCMMALLLVVVLVSCYLFAVVGTFKFGWKKVIKDSVFLTFRHLPYSICLLVIPFAAFIASYYVPYIIIGLPALAYYLDAKVLNWIFSQFMEKEEEEEETDELWELKM